jgi:hypothetical protein
MTTPQANNITNITEAIYKRMEPTMIELNKKLDALTAKVNSMEESLVVLCQENPKSHQKTETQINLLLETCKGTKPTKAKKAAAETPKEKEAAENGEVTPPAAATPKGKTLNTKPMYFRRNCAEDPKFYQTWLDRVVAKNPNHIKEMEADDAVKKKKNETDKQKARVTYLWNAVNSDKVMQAEIEVLRQKATASAKEAVDNVKAEAATPKNA